MGLIIGCLWMSGFWCNSRCFHMVIQFQWREPHNTLPNYHWPAPILQISLLKILTHQNHPIFNAAHNQVQHPILTLSEKWRAYTAYRRGGPKPTANLLPRFRRASFPYDVLIIIDKRTIKATLCDKTTFYIHPFIGSIVEPWVPSNITCHPYVRVTVNTSNQTAL